MRTTSFVAALLLVFCGPGASRIAAQACAHATEDAHAELESLRPTFYSGDPADAASRGEALRQLSSTDTAFVVTDEPTCSRVIASAVMYMRQHDPVWANGGEGNFEANVFRFGPYFVVGIIAESPPATYQTGRLNFDSDVRGKYIVLSEPELQIVRVFVGI